MKNAGISVGGHSRLRKALEAEVQREYAQELASAKNFFERLAVKKKSRNTVKKRMEQTTSPQALYSSVRFTRFFRH